MYTKKPKVKLLGKVMFHVEHIISKFISLQIVTIGVGLRECQRMLQLVREVHLYLQDMDWIVEVEDCHVFYYIPQIFSFFPFLFHDQTVDKLISVAGIISPYF